MIYITNVSCKTPIISGDCCGNQLQYIEIIQGVGLVLPGHNTTPEMMLTKFCDAPGPLFNKTPSYWYRYSYYKPETAVGASIHDDVIKWKHFPRYWPFVRGFHRSPLNSPHKGQWRGALMFSLICVWINGWVNNGEAGDLRHYRAHYDVTVMLGFKMEIPLPVTRRLVSDYWPRVSSWAKCWRVNIHSCVWYRHKEAFNGACGDQGHEAINFRWFINVD